MTVVANTILFNVKDAVDYYNPIRDISNTEYYVFTARHMPWSGANPSNITDSYKETEYTIFEELIFGKRITSDDILHMIDRYDWASGTKYAQYDDSDADLLSKKFFVVSLEGGNYHVFKCLNNNRGVASTSQPLFSMTSADDSNYITADGYQWKYMYTIESTVFNKFATTSYIPVTPNTSVTNFAVNGSIDSILLTTGGENYISFTSGAFEGVSVAGNTRLHAIQANNSSSNNDFYTGSAVYLESGIGAGQLREIVDYIISPTQHRILVDSEFNPQPDLTTQYTISPNAKLYGDGTGARAISVVNSTSLAIDRIEVVNNGINYTYADIQISGNTGTVNSVSAAGRAIVSPHQGHGSDVYSELNANKIGISVTFANSEANTLSIRNDYSRVGILKGPNYANVILTIANGTGSFATGENIVQYVGVNTAVSTVLSTVESYTYNVGNYVAIRVNANSTNFVANDVLYQTTPSAANGVVINVSGNTIIVRQDTGKFTTSASILKSSNSLVNNTINTISSGFTTYVFGLDSSNNKFTSNTASSTDIMLNGQKLYDHAILPSNTATTSYAINATAIQFYNKTLSNTDIITAVKYINNAVYVNSQYVATGTVVSSNSTDVVLTNAKGVFVVGSPIRGDTTFFTANVSLVDSPENIFVQTTKLTGEYSAMSGTFNLDDYCQQDTPGDGGAYGYIQDIYGPYSNGSSNTFYDFYLTGIKGSFSSGLDKYIQSANGGKIASVTTIRQPDLVKYTGDIIYAENIEPVQRANNQSETVKLVLKFF